MAKRTPTKTRSSFWRSQLRYWAYHRLLGLFTLAVLVLLIAWGVYAVQQEFQKHTERQNFAHAQKDINDIYRAIAKNVGQPSAHKAVQTCSYTSVEIGRGARSCDVFEYWTLNANTLDEAKMKANQIESEVKANSHFQNFKLSSWSTSGSGYSEIISAIFENTNGLSCGVDVWFYTGPKSPQDFTIMNIKPSSLLVELSCGGSAKAEYYPVVNS